jgi:hypothetical protein
MAPAGEIAEHRTEVMPGFHKQVVQALLISFLTVIILFSCEGPGSSIKRPGNVPSNAVKVNGVKGDGPWQWCELREGRIHCRIYNAGGELLYDDDFVVYVGTQPKSQGELEISPNGGYQWIRLKNGTILIPQSQKVELTRFLDWQFGKAPTRTGNH